MISTGPYTMGRDEPACVSASLPPPDAKKEKGSGSGAFSITPGRFAAALAMAVAAMFPAVLLGSRTFVFRDYGVFGYPLAYYHRQCFWNGEIPLWNPFSLCGVPFLAQWNTLTLYPLSAIYLLLPLPWSLGLFCLVHLFLAGLGMYFLSFRWTANHWAAAAAGIAFTFNGFTLNCLMWPHIIAALAWMPWVVLTMERAWARGGRHLILAALAGTLQMLTGAPELVLFTWLILLGLALMRTRAAVAFGRMLTVVLLITALSAAQLLPFFDLLAHSERDANFATSTWAMPVWGWFNLVLPLFRCIESSSGVYFQSGQFWTSSYYPGVGVLLLALLATLGDAKSKLQIGLLWGLSLLGFVLALGDAGYLYLWLRKLFPGLGFMRFPVKFALLATFALPLLAAYGLSAAWSPKFSLYARRAGLALWFGLLAVITACLWFSYRHPQEHLAWAAILQNGGIRIAVLLLVGSIVFCGFHKAGENRRVLLASALLILLAADAFTHMPRQNPTVDPSVYRPGMLADAFTIQPALGSTRAMMGRQTKEALYTRMLSDPEKDYIGRRLCLYGNCNLLDEVPTPDGFFALCLEEQRQIWTKLLAPDEFPSALADFVGIGYLATNLFAWQTRSSALPTVTSGQEPIFVPCPQMLERMLSSDFDPRRIVFLPLEAQKTVTATNAAVASVLNSKWGKGSAEFQVAALAPALLVISQSYHHPWKAYVDGQPAKIWRANHAFQALEVPPGVYSVKLIYTDRPFQYGSLISLSGLALCLLCCFRSRRLTSAA